VRPAWRWWVLALLWTLVNALKPLTVDDAAYFYYARQIAAAPCRSLRVLDLLVPVTPACD
jgi:hypothetical protein